MATVIKVKTEGGNSVKVSSTSTATGTVIKKGYSPYINEETGTWFEYDHSIGGFVDTGVKAEADPIITGVSDEFIISDEKVLMVNEIPAEKIDGLVEMIRETVGDASIATTTIPGLVLSSEQENSILVLEDGVMVVGDINVNKLVQTPGERFTLNAGNSCD